MVPTAFTELCALSKPWSKQQVNKGCFSRCLLRKAFSSPYSQVTKFQCARYQMVDAAITVLEVRIMWQNARAHETSD